MAVITFGFRGLNFGATNVMFGGGVLSSHPGRKFMPLYSIHAMGRYYGPWPHGNFYNYGLYGFYNVIYQRGKPWHGIICFKKKYVVPIDPKSPAQLVRRQKMADGVSAWQDLTGGGQAIYNSYKYPTQMSGYNRFLHYYLKV